MRNHTKATALVLAVALVASGCAMTPEHFRSSAGTMSTDDVCDQLRLAVQGRNEPLFNATRDEALRRGVGTMQCLRAAEERAETRAAVVGGLLLLGTAVAVAKSGRSVGAPSSSYSSSAASGDYSWAWDYFNGPDGSPIWRCRGIQTAQFAEDALCAHTWKSDLQWPGLGDPLRR